MKIVDFTQKLDEKIGKVLPNAVLEAAKDQLSNVLVLGMDTEGSLYIASTFTAKTEMLYLIEQFKFDLLSGDFDLYED